MEYRFVHEFAKLTSWNPDYIQVHKDFFAKYNKTSGGWNFLGTLKQDLGADLSVCCHVTITDLSLKYLFFRFT